MLVKIHPIGEIEDDKLKYAVICSIYQNQLLLVLPHQRTTWEIPGGKRDNDETIENTASRELFEETGAVKYSLLRIADYSVTISETISFGSLFWANVETLGELPVSEISQIGLFNSLPKHITYPEIQPILMEYALNQFSNKNILFKE